MSVDMALDPNHQPENPNIASARYTISGNNEPYKKALGENVLATINNNALTPPDPDRPVEPGYFGTPELKNNQEFISKVGNLQKVMGGAAEVLTDIRNKEAERLSRTDHKSNLAA